MVDPIRLTEAADKDAAYVLRKIADAEQHAQNALEHKDGAASELKLASEARIEAGKRLIEVRQRWASDKAMSDAHYHAPGWHAWLRDNDIPEATARRYMKEVGHSEEERTEKKQKDAKRKKEARAKPSRIGWVNLLAARCGGSIHIYKDRKVQIETAIGRTIPMYFTDAAEMDAFVLAYINAFPNKVITPSLPETAQQKLERAIAIETARLRAEFQKALYAEVEKQSPEIIADRERIAQENRDETARYRLLNMNTRKFITAAEYRKLIWALHPDRAPEERKEEFNTATIIVMKLKDYAEA